MNTILSIKEALEIMNTGKPFSITVATYDQRRKTGGDRDKYTDATLVHLGGPPKPEAAAPMSARSANHRDHSTFNIRTKMGDIVSIHIPLIEKLNGQRIAL